MQKQKIVVDTNIVISALLGKSYPYNIVFDLVLRSKVNLYLSKSILMEYQRTIGYSKFQSISRFNEKSKQLVNDLKSISIIRNPQFMLEILGDKDDNKFLELALSSQADFLITGNIKHFPFSKFENTEILSPEKYWNTYWK
jgi:uncharacterized protein